MLCSGIGDRVPDYFSHGWHEYTAARDPAGDWRDVFQADDREAFSRTFAELLRTGRPSEVELGMIRRDGTTTRQRLNLLVADGEARPTRWFAIAEEVRASEPLASRIDGLIAWVSHELRAPIATMLLWEEVLRMNTDADVHARGLDAIRQSATTQERLVRDLLDVARASSGKLHLELRTVSLSRTLEEAIEVIEPVATSKRHRIARDIELGLEVTGDATRLRQVIDNLLSNAMKFTPGGGSVSVHGRRAGQSIVVEVVDSGRGMSGEFLAQAFELFSQADDTVARTEGGLGLGLAIARDIVRMHGGSLTADSEGHDRGTTLKMTLPALVRRLDANVETRAMTPHKLDGLRLLVVDDDPRVCDALEILLSRAGAAVETATSASAAIEAVERAAPDIVLSDIAMPGEDGFSLLRRLQQRGTLIRTIAITAHAGSRQRAIAAGFDRLVAKPLNVDRLIETIVDLAESRSAHSERC